MFQHPLHLTANQEKSLTSYYQSFDSVLNNLLKEKTLNHFFNHRVIVIDGP